MSVDRGVQTVARVYDLQGGGTEDAYSAIALSLQYLSNNANISSPDEETSTTMRGDLAT